MADLTRARRRLTRLMVVAMALLAAGAADALAADKAFNPFGRRRRSKYRYWGVFTMSDGTVYEGPTRIGARGTIKVYDMVHNKHRDLTLGVIKEIDCEVSKEWYEKIWRWKEGGEHVKIDTGQSYPVRKFVHKVHFVPDEEDDEDEPSVLEATMRGVIFVQVKATKLRNRDICLWRGLSTKLSTEGTEDDTPSPSRRIWQLLPKDIQKTMERTADEGTLAYERKFDITAALNKILAMPDFYKKEDFADVDLPDEAKELLSRDRASLKPQEVMRLNRLLFKAAFPEEIGKSVTEKKLWYNETLGDKGMIGKKLDSIVYIKKMVFTTMKEHEASKKK